MPSDNGENQPAPQPVAPRQLTHVVRVAEITRPNAWRGYSVTLTSTNDNDPGESVTRELKAFQVQSSTPSVEALTIAKRRATRYARETARQIGATFVERMAFHVTAGMVVTIESDPEAQIPRYDPKMVENSIKSTLRGLGNVLKATNVTVEISTLPLLSGEA